MTEVERVAEALQAADHGCRMPNGDGDLTVKPAHEPVEREDGERVLDKQAPILKAPQDQAAPALRDPEWISRRSEPHPSDVVQRMGPKRHRIPVERQKVRLVR